MRSINVSGFRSGSGLRLGSMLVLFFAAVAGHADTIKLKDGTVLDGDIVSETSTQLVIELQFAAGTISTKQIVNRADVAEVTRLTEEEKAFQRVQEYRLDPNTSEPQSYYEHVIQDVYRQFLNRFPNSPHAGEVNQRIAEWTAERDKVAGGLARVGSEWMPKAEAEKRTDLFRTRVLLDEGRTLMVQSNYWQALERFKTVISTSKLPDLVDEAKGLYADTCRVWFELLERQGPVLADEVKSYGDRVTRTLQQKTEAGAKLQAAGRTPGATSARLRVDYEHAYAEYLNASNHLAVLHQKLSGLDLAIAQAQAYATAYSVSLLPAGSSPAQPSPATKTEAATNQPPSGSHQATTSDAPEGILGFIQRYWILGVAVFIGGLWAASRLTTRRR